MLYFFQKKQVYFVVQSLRLSKEDIRKLKWLFGEATHIKLDSLNGFFKGFRVNMVSPWSTNAVEITQNMGIHTVERIEKFKRYTDKDVSYDPMLETVFPYLTQDLFSVTTKTAPILYIEDIEAYNKKEGLSLSDEEVNYLKDVSEEIG